MIIVQIRLILHLANQLYRLNPLVDDNITAEVSSANSNLILQQEEEGIDVKTVITNVIDGNGKDVPFDSYIYSPDITFEFLGLKDGVETDEVDGFECKLDEGDFEECGSDGGIAYSVSGEPHRFEVRSYIYVGGTFDKIYDPTPATWEWDVGGFTVQTTSLVAEDENGVPIPNNGSTPSNDIVFRFTGSTTQEDISAKGFECSLEEETLGHIAIPFDESCVTLLAPSDPFEGTEGVDDLAPGNYTFTVNACIEEESGGELSILEHINNCNSNTLQITFTIVEAPIVVETTLEAEDGDGDTITDGDSTTSNDIEFTFSGETNAPPGSFSGQDLNVH